MSALLTWLNAGHLAAQQTYQAQRDPYHEGMVDALDRVIARVEKQAPPDLAPLRELKHELTMAISIADKAIDDDSYVDTDEMRAAWEARRPLMQAVRESNRVWLTKLTRALDALEAGR